MKFSRTPSSGFSVGVAAVAATVLTITPAAAALHSLSWHVKKSNNYCGSLPRGTTAEQMKKAACESQTLALHQMVITQMQQQQSKTEAEIASSMNWPGPGH